jgi:hypothetical protein
MTTAGTLTSNSVRTDSSVLVLWHYWPSTERDEKDAIDTSNIIDERTRGATKKAGTYTEPSDEEGLDEVTADGQDGTSAGRQ